MYFASLNPDTTVEMFLQSGFAPGGLGEASELSDTAENDDVHGRIFTRKVDSMHSGRNSTDTCVRMTGSEPWACLAWLKEASAGPRVLSAQPITDSGTREFPQPCDGSASWARQRLWSF